ncbi:MAG: ferrous iron transport protein A [Anaerolineae bacterium]|jgi:ferrous iron transport protein A|nr:ferrous iron transport protein A [Anaerolineae bacterium]MBT4310422.1 ferrous iron transport protein A [Anaerolineae bacterium]MBT4842846.1 ferrous iron transport protein A [Anaerolineae bacterium]MBT6061082.1 ferrous iron transport protein A [Anaerolineae bacterium]MBT6321259.1 ferrous iron transport protein A [Anaerolineae bacterium]
MVLLDVEKGKRVRVLSLNGGTGLEDKLTQHGLYPGDCVRVLRTAPLGGPLLVDVHGREIALGRGIAEKIKVEESKCE